MGTGNMHNVIVGISKKCKIRLLRMWIMNKVIHIVQAIFYGHFELCTELSTLSTVYEVESVYG